MNDSPSASAEGASAFASLDPELGLTARSILDVVRRNGPIPRSEIAAAVNLSVQSVTTQTKVLERAGLLVSQVSASQGRGAPAAAFSINPVGAFGVGLHLARRHITATAVDLSGCVAKTLSRSVTYPSLDEALVAAKALASDLMASGAFDAARVLGVGVAVPGKLRRSDGMLIPPTTMPNWDSVDIGAWARAVFGPRTLVENNANAAAIGEAMFFEDAAAGSSMLYVYVGSGVGAGLVLSGTPWRGDRGFAGEVGALPILPVTFPDGSVVRHLSFLLSTAGLSHWLGRDTDVGLDEPTLATLLDRRDPALLDWLDQAAAALGAVLATLQLGVDPSITIIGGSAPACLRQALLTGVAGWFDGAEVQDFVRPAMALGRSGDLAASVGAASLPIARAIGWDGSATEMRLAWARGV